MSLKLPTVNGKINNGNLHFFIRDCFTIYASIEKEKLRENEEEKEKLTHHYNFLEDSPHAHDLLGPVVMVK